MRLLISLWFITFCAALLVSDHSAFSPKTVKKYAILGQTPSEVTFRDFSEENVETKTSNCDTNPPVIPNMEDIGGTEDQPEPIGSYDFDWAGLSHKKNEENDFLDTSQVIEKRNKQHHHRHHGDFERGYLKHVHLYPPSCACQTKFRLFDLGANTFPKYVLNAVCINRQEDSRNCWLGSKCKEIPYIVRVLTHRNSENDSINDDEMANLLPHDLKSSWKFKSVKVSAACQCAL